MYNVTYPPSDIDPSRERESQRDKAFGPNTTAVGVGMIEGVARAIEEDTANELRAELINPTEEKMEMRAPGRMVAPGRKDTTKRQQKDKSKCKSNQQ